MTSLLPVCEFVSLLGRKERVTEIKDFQPVALISQIHKLYIKWLAKAFDRLSHDQILFHLLKSPLKPRLASLIARELFGGKLCFWAFGVCSGDIDQETGVKQGSPESRPLFSLESASGLGATWAWNSISACPFLLMFFSRTTSSCLACARMILGS